VGDTIHIEVRLYATLRQHRPQLQPGEPFIVSLASDCTAAQLLERELEIPPQVVKTIFVNGAARELSYVFTDGDRVGIFPPIAGG